MAPCEKTLRTALSRARAAHTLLSSARQEAPQHLDGVFLDRLAELYRDSIVPLERLLTSVLNAQAARQANARETARRARR